MPAGSAWCATRSRAGGIRGRRRTTVPSSAAARHPARTAGRAARANPGGQVAERLDLLAPGQPAQLGVRALVVPDVGRAPARLTRGADDRRREVPVGRVHRLGRRAHLVRETTAWLTDVDLLEPEDVGVEVGDSRAQRDVVGDGLAARPPCRRSRGPARPRHRAPSSRAARCTSRAGSSHGQPRRRRAVRRRSPDPPTIDKIAIRGHDGERNCA